jgi:regulatory protein
VQHCLVGSEMCIRDSLFAGGKFRIKHWGKVKIKYELQLHKVSPYNIKKALQQIDEDDYLKTLQNIATKYYSSLKGKKIAKDFKAKTYLQQKGFELNLIHEVLKKIK